MRVSITPGHSAFTVIPYIPKLADADCVIAASLRCIDGGAEDRLALALLLSLAKTHRQFLHLLSRFREAFARAELGPGLAAVGPTGNFAFFAGWQKLVMVLLMLLGRLEFFAVLALLQRQFWRR